MIQPRTELERQELVRALMRERFRLPPWWRARREQQEVKAREVGDE